MFRPTHFVILFGVFLCAYAAPAAPGTPAVDALTKAPSKMSPIGYAEGEGERSKEDLETDATAYLRISYGPRLGYYVPRFGARAYGWGFRKSIGIGPLPWY